VELRWFAVVPLPRPQLTPRGEFSAHGGGDGLWLEGGGVLLVRVVTFPNSRPQVGLAEGVRRTIIAENLVQDAERITNLSEGKDAHKI
jgi:hypothetical protein